MRKKIKIIFLFILVVLVGIQFVPTKLNQSNEIRDTDIAKVYDTPIEISQILTSSCYDCHSNNTNYPWYSTIQPGAWFMEEHIAEGKEELNFSEFGDYSGRRKKNKLKSIVKQVEQDKMPISSYTLIHPDAALSEAEKKMIVQWVDGLID